MIEDGTAIVLAYVLVSIGVIVAFLWAVFMVGWFIGRRRECRRARLVATAAEDRLIAHAYDSRLNFQLKIF